MSMTDLLYDMTKRNLSKGSQSQIIDASKEVLVRSTPTFRLRLKQVSAVCVVA